MAHPRKLNVLIGCEFSGVVREAFRKRGHNAYSCDILPARDGSQWHLKCNVLYVLHPNPDATYYRGAPWDLAIFHPPCTYLANSGVKHLYKGGRKVNGEDPKRWENMRKAASLFDDLWRSGIPKLAIENPIMHGHGRDLISCGEPTQIIQPYQFGHPEQKATCLWLQGLPPLVETDNVYEEMMQLPRKERERIHFESPGPDRGLRRSVTFQGIANAMADQWG